MSTQDYIFRPKYITFDCYGTLIRMCFGEMARKLYADVVPAERMEQFIKDFSAYRLDEVLGDWQPYREVIGNALARTAKKWGLEYREEYGEEIYQAVPTWGPHADVPHALTRVGKKIPLVILSNAMNEQIHSNVAKLQAPFHKVYTAQDAGAYKPRLAAFEYMLDQLGCAPQDVLHVSANPRYDIFPADNLGIETVGYDGHQWTRAKGWTAAPPPPTAVTATWAKV